MAETTTQIRKGSVTVDCAPHATRVTLIIGDASDRAEVDLLPVDALNLAEALALAAAKASRSTGQ